MEEIKDGLRRLNQAVFGDPERPKEKPGLLMETAMIEKAVQENTQCLEGLRGDLRKGVWLVISTVLLAILASVLKK